MLVQMMVAPAGALKLSQMGTVMGGMGKSFL
jgi:hypothetical protein